MLTVRFTCLHSNGRQFSHTHVNPYRANLYHHRMWELGLTLSLPLATIVDTVPVPLATKVDRTSSVPLAMIVAVFTNVRGITCFQIFTPHKPGTGSQKIGSERVKVGAVDYRTCKREYSSCPLHTTLSQANSASYPQGDFFETQCIFCYHHMCSDSIAKAVSFSAASVFWVYMSPFLFQRDDSWTVWDSTLDFPCEQDVIKARRSSKMAAFRCTAVLWRCSCYSNVLLI